MLLSQVQPSFYLSRTNASQTIFFSINCLLSTAPTESFSSSLITGILLTTKSKKLKFQAHETSITNPSKSQATQVLHTKAGHETGKGKTLQNSNH